MRPPGARHVVRGQYGPGYIEGKKVPGYREEPGVAPTRGRRRSSPPSSTSTTGAGPARRSTSAPASGCRSARRRSRSSSSARRIRRSRRRRPRGCGPNVLVVHVQPDEGVSLAIGAKVPGQGLTIRTVHMDFLYGGAFRTELPEAYERLILDCLLGDATLFTRADEVDAQWALVDSIVAGWTRDRTPFPNYDAGTWGPAAADEAARAGRDASGADAERHLGRRDRAAARRAPGARGDLAADERAHAHGVGPARVGARGRPRARGPRPAGSVADDPAPPRSRGARDDGSTPRSSTSASPWAGTRSAPSRPDLAARRDGEGAGERRRRRFRSPTCRSSCAGAAVSPFGSPHSSSWSACTTG